MPLPTSRLLGAGATADEVTALERDYSVVTPLEQSTLDQILEGVSTSDITAMLDAWRGGCPFWGLSRIGQSFAMLTGDPADDAFALGRGTGAPVSAGSGVPNGGTTGQTLVKQSSTDGDAVWADLPETVIESVNATTAGTAQTIPPVTAATMNFLTLSAASCALTFPAAEAGAGFTLALRQDATGGRHVSWPATTLWPGGAVPALTTDPGAIDVFSFLCVDGTAWIGFLRGGASLPMPVRAAILGSVPLSYWRLGETSGTTAADQMAVNAGTYTGGVTLGVTGLLDTETDKAASFDGVDDHVVVKNGQILSGLTNWTVEAIIKPTLGKDGVIYGERGSSGNDILDINLHSNGRLDITYRDHAGTIDQPGVTSTGITANTRHRIAVTKAGTSVKFYVDGAQVGSTATLTASDTFGEATAHSWIAGDPNDPTGNFPGIIDEVALYSRALPQSELAAHVAADVP